MSFHRNYWLTFAGSEQSAMQTTIALREQPHFTVLTKIAATAQITISSSPKYAIFTHPTL